MNVLYFQFTFRLGHPSATVENRLGKHYATYAEAANSKSAQSKDICEACARGKSRRSLPKKSTSDSITVQAPLELVHSDVCGPFSHPFAVSVFCGYCCVILII